MRTILILASLLVATNSFSQLIEGYINDPDGYTNVRNGQSSSANIITTISSGEIFTYDSISESNWWLITKTDGTNGFVHKSRIVSVETMTSEIIKLMNDIRSSNPNDVEFGEFSNERLFIYAEKFPKAFINAFDKLDEQVAKLIVKELETPIHDMIDLRLVYNRISHVGYFPKSSKKIQDAIIIAGKKMNLDVTKE